MKRLALIPLVWFATPITAHPHIFVDVGFEVVADKTGRLTQIKVTWAYDALFSLLITEDYELDADGDAVLTPAEEAELTGFDMQWVKGYNGDVVATLGGKALTLSRPKKPTAVMREGRIVTTHLRNVRGKPALIGQELLIKPFDPSYYTAYNVTLAVTVKGIEGCMIDKQEPDMDKEILNLQAELEKLSRDQDSIEMGFPEVGASFATEVRFSCAGF